MYSFASHPMTASVNDEPLYGRHLHTAPHISRPYKDELLASQPQHESSKACLDLLTKHSTDPLKPIVFHKHMAKQAPLLSLAAHAASATTASNSTSTPHKDILTKHKHIILLRDPMKVIQSWSAAVAKGSVPTTTLEEIGLADLVSLHSTLSNTGAWGGNNVAVVDSHDLINDAEATLTAIMEKFQLPFDAAMLKWKSGPKQYDGCWASSWYEGVHASTGWSPASKALPSTYAKVDPILLPLYKTCLPLYTLLRSYSIVHPAAKYTDVTQLQEDPRNEKSLYFVGSAGSPGALYPRDLASMVPYDSAVQGGDGVWEGVRIYRNKIFKFERHLKRLFDSAHALNFKNQHTPEEVKDAVFRTLAANNIRDGGHIRLTLTRGIKCTSSMNPKFNVYGTTLIVAAEFKATQGRTTYDNVKGVKLISSSGRRNGPDLVDSKIHHNNLINNIIPKIQANNAGAADALMLGIDGFVSETNACNVFCVRDGVLCTPHADYCLPGITRESVLLIGRELGMEVKEGRFSLVEFMTADEVFTTGTMGELTPVYEIDGRTIADGKGAGPVTKRLQEVYKDCPEREGWSTPIPEFV
ncbi:hypothetical protein TrST_g13495 [Triparma strigata]|uniref:Branched-chain-amino-acid aminotransferase n=1 Tax=Triparma strigata TaxID=1606541 RepID=A0A9W7E7B1_9STRA|nr:hypothetical protein TrST_g13495 [Triparma strigata]